MGRAMRRGAAICFVIAVNILALPYFFANVRLGELLGIELGQRAVSRRPFNVPRLGADVRFVGRPVTADGLEQRVRESASGTSRYRDDYDLPNLVALDPERGFRVAREILLRGAREGRTDFDHLWSPLVASYDDDWARAVKRELALYARIPSDVADDPVRTPGLGEYGNEMGDDFTVRVSTWTDGASEIAPPLGEPPKERGVLEWSARLTGLATLQGLRTEEETLRAFSDAATAGQGRDLALWASNLFPDLPAPVRSGVLRAYGENPASFARTAIGDALDPAARLPFTPRDGRDVENYAKLWSILMLAKRAAVRAEAIRRLSDAGTWAAGELLKATPEDEDLRRRLHAVRWSLRQIVPMVEEGSTEALAYAVKWGSDGNPVHECDLALLGHLSVADAATERVLRSRASRARALLLDGLRRRADGEALRRIRVLARDPSPRVARAAGLILKARGLGGAP